MIPRLAVFRADASTAIGTGHVVRCGTLALALAHRGWATALAARSLPADLAAEWPGGPGMVIPVPEDAPLAAEPHLLGARTDRAPTLVVGDHYGLDAGWFEQMRGEQPGAVLMAIDDLADRRLPVDLVLNQNLPVTEASYAGLAAPGTRVLAGPGYALLRPEFAALRDRGRVRDGRIGRILVFMSGADRSDVTQRVVRALGRVDDSIDVDVVVGAAYDHLAGIRDLVARMPAARLHVSTTSMAVLMDDADLAIGAPGSASWERCALGLPAILVTLADNQVAVGRALEDLGACVGLGWHADVSAADIEGAVRALRADPSRVARMSRAASEVTDGRGTDRVVLAIEELVSGRMVG